MEKQPIIPSPEEQAQIAKSRTLSDAELIKGGADYVPTESSEPRLEVTEKQINETKKEMVRDFESNRKENISDEEIKSEMEKKFSNTLQKVAQEINGKIEGTGTYLVRVESHPNPSKDTYSPLKPHTCEISLTLDGDKIRVSYNSYFRPDIYNRYEQTFSSIFTPGQIAYTAGIFSKAGYGSVPYEGSYRDSIERFKDDVESGKIKSDFWK